MHNSIDTHFQYCKHVHMKSEHKSFTQVPTLVHVHTGPWLTFEIQLPQDDFHLLAWVLGERIDCGELDEARRTYHLRGLESDEKLLDGETCVWIEL